MSCPVLLSIATSTGLKGFGIGRSCCGVETEVQRSGFLTVAPYGSNAVFELWTSTSSCIPAYAHAFFCGFDRPGPQQLANPSLTAQQG